MNNYSIQGVYEILHELEMNNIDTDHDGMYSDECKWCTERVNKHLDSEQEIIEYCKKCDNELEEEGRFRNSDKYCNDCLEESESE